MIKKITTLSALAALLCIVACDPIEDQSLREKYITNAGDPMTSEELSSHLTVSQISETDDVITVVNDDPTIGGIWHFTSAAGDAILKTDKGTYTYTSNGNFEVYMVAPTTGGKLVESKHFPITVEDVYDPWVGMLTGAKDKFDKSATKTWGFRSSNASDGKDLNGDPTGTICGMSAYGFWKWYPHSQTGGQAWWGVIKYGTAGDQTMKFSYAGGKLETFASDGSAKNSGAFVVDHTPFDASPANTKNGCAQMGKFSATCPVIGSEYDDYGQSGTTQFILVYLDDTYMTIAHYPNYSACTSSLDWCDAVWICSYKAK